MPRRKAVAEAYQEADVPATELPSVVERIDALQRKYVMLVGEAAVEAFGLVVQAQIKWAEAFFQALPVTAATLRSRLMERRVRAVVIKFPDRRTRPWG